MQKKAQFDFVNSNRYDIIAKILATYDINGSYDWIGKNIKQQPPTDEEIKTARAIPEVMEHYPRMLEQIKPTESSKPTATPKNENSPLSGGIKQATGETLGNNYTPLDDVELVSFTHDEPPIKPEQEPQNSDLKRNVDSNVPNAPEKHATEPEKTPELEHLLSLILSKVKKQSFADLIDKQSGIKYNHQQYYTKDGNLKIPLPIYAVVGNRYMYEVVESTGMAIAQLYSNDADAKVGYLFTGKYWIQLSQGVILDLLRGVLIKMGYDPLQCHTAGFGKLLTETFWCNAPKTPTTDNKKTFINLENTTLEINADGSITQRKHCKEDFMLYCLPYHYNPNAICPIFTKYLNRVLPDKESQIVLQELLGSIFTKHKLEKIGVLFGDGSNGKSVLLLIMNALLGKENMSQWSLKALTTDGNAANNRANLFGKLLNFAPEMDSKGQQAHELIKAMASCETIQGKLLYKNTFQFECTCRLMFNANKFISDVEHSTGFWRRWLIIVFGETITDAEKDPDLHNKIIANELPGILNWIIEGAIRLHKNKGKFSPCKKSDDALAEQKLDSDIVAQWIEDNGYVANEISSISLSDLYLDFCKYANNRGYKNLPVDKTISDRLRKLKFTERKGKPLKFYMIKKAI